MVFASCLVAGLSFPWPIGSSSGAGLENWSPQKLGMVILQPQSIRLSSLSMILPFKWSYCKHRHSWTKWFNDHPKISTNVSHMSFPIMYVPISTYIYHHLPWEDVREILGSLMLNHSKPPLRCRNTPSFWLRELVERRRYPGLLAADHFEHFCPNHILHLGKHRFLQKGRLYRFFFL